MHQILINLDPSRLKEDGCIEDTPKLSQCLSVINLSLPLKQQLKFKMIQEDTHKCEELE